MTSSITVPRKKQIDLLIKEDTILLYFISLNLEVIVAHVILVDIDPRLSVEDLRALVVLFEQQALIAFCLKIHTVCDLLALQKFQSDLIHCISRQSRIPEGDLVDSAGLKILAGNRNKRSSYCEGGILQTHLFDRTCSTRDIRHSGALEADDVRTAS